MENLSPFEDLCSSLDRVEALKDSATHRLQNLSDQVDSLEADVEVLDRVADLFRALIDQEVVDNAKTVEDLLTEGLQAIFDDLDLSVKSEVDVQRGKVSVDLLTVQKEPDGTTIEGSSTDAYGGSVSTVQSVLLRVVVVSRRGMRPLLLLDESLGAIAEHYVPRVGKFLSVLCDRMSIDILAVSHNPALIEAADTSYRISKKGGTATLKRLRT